MCYEVLAYIDRQWRNNNNNMGACILFYTVLTNSFSLIHLQSGSKANI